MASYNFLNRTLIGDRRREAVRYGVEFEDISTGDKWLFSVLAVDIYSALRKARLCPACLGGELVVNRVWRSISSKNYVRESWIRK